jgi:hypothetical protein
VPDRPLPQDSPDAVYYVVGREARGFIDDEYAIHGEFGNCVSL